MEGLSSNIPYFIGTSFLHANSVNGYPHVLHFKTISCRVVPILMDSTHCGSLFGHGTSITSVQRRWKVLRPGAKRVTFRNRIIHVFRH